MLYRVLASIVILGKACDLIDHHQEQKKASTVSMSSPQKHSNSAAEMSSATSPEAAAKEAIMEAAMASTKPTKSLSPLKVEEKELSLGSQVTSAEDISLLEAKLQRIDATRAFSNPSAPVLAEVFFLHLWFFFDLDFLWDFLWIIFMILLLTDSDSSMFYQITVM